MNIVNVLVINSDFRYKLGFSNKQLQDLSKILVKPSERNMVNYLSEDTIESLSNSTKYYISGDDDTESYQLDILKELLNDINNDWPVLKSIASILGDDKLEHTLIGYLSKEKNGNQELFLYQLKRTNLIKDRGFFVLKKKIAATKNKRIEVEQIDNGFNLPTSDCLASIYKRQDNSEGKQYKVKVYQAYLFDEVFQTSETQHKYVERTLNKFQTSIKITKDDGVAISFEKANLTNLKNVIYSDNQLMKTFSNYHDNKNRIIKKIEYNKLEEVLKILKSHVENNADAEFEIKNIPNLIDDRLEVTEDSIPTFAALLDNKVIQRLLNNRIEIPYFKKHPNN